MKRLFLSLLIFLFVGGYAGAATKYVSLAGTGDGDSVGSPDTFEDAFTALKATDGDHIIYFVEAGTYYLSGSFLNWNATGDGLELKAYPGLTADDIIIDGENSRGFLIFNRDGHDFLIEGITLQNFQGTPTSVYGAMYIMRANSVTVKYCKILNNRSIFNGGDCAGAGLFVSNLCSGAIIIEDSQYIGNTAFPDDGSAFGQGGAVYCKGTGSISVLRNIFTGNSASNSTGGMIVQNTAAAVRLSGNVWTGNFSNARQAGAVKIVGDTTGDVIIDGDTYIENHNYGAPTLGAGGGVKLSLGACAEIKNCKFIGNSADVGGAIDCGGAFAVTTTLTNNIFIQNSARNGGAWAATTLHSVNAYNNTYYNNTCAENGQDIKISAVALTATLRNEIHQFNAVFDESNTTQLIYVDTATVLDIQHCNIEGGADAVTGEDTYTDNLNTDPLFRDIAREKFTLKTGSPCLNAGVDVSLTRDYNDWLIVGTPSMGAYQYTQDVYQKITGVLPSVNTKSATGMLSYSDAGVIFIDCTAGAVSLYVPPLANSSGLDFLFFKTDATVNTLTVLPSDASGTINGAASQTLDDQYNTLKIFGGPDEWATW